MRLPQLLEKQAIKQLERFCQQAAADPRQPRAVGYRIEGLQVSLFELRDADESTQPRKLAVALLRYSPDLNQWTLHQRTNERWRLYLNVNPTLDLSKLLRAVAQDPLGAFWPDEKDPVSF